MRARKSLGQCFLTDRNILEKEARIAAVEGKVVLEIGAGDGRLTEALLAQEPKKLIAIEKDERFASVLRERFKHAAEAVVDIVMGDFLEMDLPEFDIAVGNIPYYISSGIIFKLAKCRFERAVLMVQKEFAEKMAAKPGDRNYGRLSVTSQLAFSVELVQKVPAHLFSPKPKVDSAIIILIPTGMLLTQFQEDVIRWLFQHRNKTVRNALLDSGKFDKPGLEALGAFASRKVRTLAKEEVLRIAGMLPSHSENSSAS